MKTKDYNYDNCDVDSCYYNCDGYCSCVEDFRDSTLGINCTSYIVVHN